MWLGLRITWSDGDNWTTIPSQIRKDAAIGEMEVPLFIPETTVNNIAKVNKTI